MKNIKIEIAPGVEVPERKEPLSFTEWCNDRRRGVYAQKIDHNKSLWNNETLDHRAEQYAHYLSTFKEEPSVLEKWAMYKEGRNGEIGSFTRINRVVYNGRCKSDGDLFTVYHGKVHITHCQGQFKSPYILIED